MLTILIVLAVLLLVGAMPAWPYSRNWGYGPSGGLGLILAQWAKALGARVIGTVGSDEKAAVARLHGVERTVVHTRENFVEATREFTQGRGADFVVDGIGGDTFNRSLDALAPFGMAASIGQVAGEVASIDLARLHASRSISVSRPGVFRFMADSARYRDGCNAVFERLAAGLRVRVGERLPLERAAYAHELLESGRSAGSLLLIPGGVHALHRPARLSAATRGR